jgi:hypothetical protein
MELQISFFFSPFLVSEPPDAAEKRFELAVMAFSVFAA